MTITAEVSSSSTDELSGVGYIKKYSRQMLKNSLFIGTFQEKRFVEPLNAYRDVVTVAREEEDFITNLKVVVKKIEEGFMKKPWLGITDPDTVGAPVGYNLWVELKEEVFGKYWYQVKTVEFHANEIRLKLGVVRPVEQRLSPLRTNSPDAEQSTDTTDFKEYFDQICQALKLSLTSTLTFKNIKESVIFLSLLIGAIITGGISMIQYLLEYLLKLIREVSFLIKAITPIIIGCFDMIWKSMSGFYSMIITMFLNKNGPAPVYNAYVNYDPNMDYNNVYNHNYRTLEYPTRRTNNPRAPGLRITPYN